MKKISIDFFSSGARNGYLAALKYADFTDEFCHEICHYLCFEPFRNHILYANTQYPVTEFDSLLELNPLENPKYLLLMNRGIGEADEEVFLPEDFDGADESDQDIDDGTYF